MDTISHHGTPTATRGNAALRALVVLAHPERRSFNGAMADVAVETLHGLGHQVAFSDLYRIGFDPVSDRRNFVSVKIPISSSSRRRRIMPPKPADLRRTSRRRSPSSKRPT